MHTHERAAQIWPVLALAAMNRQILTYDMVAGFIGMARQGLGQSLEPIQSYCLLHELPPLTILVVKKDSGSPGPGFIAAGNIPRDRQRVFEYDWRARGCPTPENFEHAVRERPSNATP